MFGTKSEKLILSDNLQESFDLSVIKNEGTSPKVPAKDIIYEKNKGKTKACTWVWQYAD